MVLPLHLLEGRGLSDPSTPRHVLRDDDLHESSDPSVRLVEDECTLRVSHCSASCTPTRPGPNIGSNANVAGPCLTLIVCADATPTAAP